MMSRVCCLCGQADQSRVFAEADYDFANLDAFAFASRKVPEYMHFRLMECRRCDLLYCSPVPTADTLAYAYHEAAFDSAEEARFAARTYAGALEDIARQLPDRDGVIDVGTGDGAFLRELLSRGFTGVMGVEPSAAPIAAAPAELRGMIRQGVFRGDVAPPSSQTLITCFQTLEHVPDPSALCRDAYQLLKPGGAAYFVGHNRRAMSAVILGKRSPIFDIEHLQLLSPQSARILLAAAGFERISVRAIWNCYPLHYWLRLLPLSRGVKSRLLNTLKRRWFGRLTLAVPAGNISMVGYRPRPGQLPK